MTGDRVLLLCSRPPWPLLGGDRLRTWHLARALSRLGPVDLVTLADSGSSLAELQAGLPFVDQVWALPLRKVPAALRVAGALGSGRALQQALYDERAVRDRVAEALDTGSYRVVVAHLLRTLPWVPAGASPLVLDLQDAISAQYRASRGRRRGWRGLAMAIEERRVFKAEQAAVQRADGLSFISEADLALVSPGQETPAVVALPAVSPERCRPPGAVPVAGRVGFIGNLRTASNQDMVRDFVLTVLPQLQQIHPGVEFRIFGVEAPPAIQALGERPGVLFVGPVDDLGDAIGTCWATVCPLRFGSGVQNKVLESMAVGTPVVVTPQVASSLPAGATEALCVVPEEESFAGILGQLLDDGAERQRLSGAGQRYVRSVHHPDRALAPLIELIEALGPAGHDS